MTFREKVDRRLALGQWRRLVKTLQAAGADVELLEPEPLSSALPFTADGALCYAPGRALVLRNDGPRGDLEPPVFKRWLEGHGYESEALPPGLRLDGGNIVQVASGELLMGLKPGTSGLAERYVTRLLRLTTGAHVTAVPLVDQRYLHLDTVVGAVGDQALLVYRDGLLGDPLSSVAALAERETLFVRAHDACVFACNTITVGTTLITGPVSRSLGADVRALGFSVERLDLSEFYKAGGGAKCLTLPLVPARYE